MTFAAHVMQLPILRQGEVVSLRKRLCMLNQIGDKLLKAVCRGKLRDPQLKIGESGLPFELGPQADQAVDQIQLGRPTPVLRGRQRFNPPRSQVYLTAIPEGTESRRVGRGAFFPWRLRLRLIPLQICKADPIGAARDGDGRSRAKVVVDRQVQRNSAALLREFMNRGTLGPDAGMIELGLVAADEPERLRVEG